MAEQKGTAVPEKQQRPEDQSRQTMVRRSTAQDIFGANPFELMRQMSDEMDRLFEDVGFRRSLMPRIGAFGAGEATRWSPRIEVFQEGDRFIVRAELPGLKKDEVDVNVTDEAITIAGERRHEQKERREGFYHTERSYGSFYRTIPLPSGTIADTADASFRDGVLEVTVQAPPHEVSRGRRIEIKEGAERRPEK